MVLEGRTVRGPSWSLTQSSGCIRCIVGCGAVTERWLWDSLFRSPPAPQGNRNEESLSSQELIQHIRLRAQESAFLTSTKDSDKSGIALGKVFLGLLTVDTVGI